MLEQPSPISLLDVTIEPGLVADTIATTHVEYKVVCVYRNPHEEFDRRATNSHKYAVRSIPRMCSNREPTRVSFLFGERCL